MRNANFTENDVISSMTISQEKIIADTDTV